MSCGKNQISLKCSCGHSCSNWAKPLYATHGFGKCCHSHCKKPLEGILVEKPCDCGNYCGCSSFQSGTCCSCGKLLTQVPAFPAYTPHTQKAKGVLAIAKQSWSGMQALKVLGVFPVKEPLPENITDDWFANRQVFARPCPPSPEHGFVESRKINSREELEALRQETLAANEDSEILLTPLIAAKWNAVWTPSMLAIGPGHDGATAGKNAISFPLAGVNPLSNKLLQEAGIAEGKAPYVEIVCSKDTPSMYESMTPTVTQLRAGPILASTNPDFIPHDVLVQEIRKTNGEDLLEWAKVSKALAGQENVVVWHPGGTLVDHYSVHCREQGVPIVTTFEPKVGQLLSANGSALEPLDPASMILGLTAADMGALPNHAACVTLGLMALHNSSALRGSAAFWIGAGIGSIIKLGVAALEGEARHAHSCFKGMTNKPDIYEYYCSKSLSYLRARVSRVSQLLHWGFGDPDNKAHGAYGGKKWALCGAALCPLLNAIRKLVTTPSEQAASECILALNIAINQAHNGGWWLNKFIGVEAYTNVPEGNIGALIRAVPAIREFSSRREDASKQVEKFTRAVSKWPVETLVQPLRWRRIGLDIAPGAFVLNLKASTLPETKQIAIPATPQLVKTLAEKIGTIKVERGRVDLVSGEGVVTNLWKEEPLEMAAREIKQS